MLNKMEQNVNKQISNFEWPIFRKKGRWRGLNHLLVGFQSFWSLGHRSNEPSPDILGPMGPYDHPSTFVFPIVSTLYLFMITLGKRNIKKEITRICNLIWKKKNTNSTFFQKEA